MTQHKSWQNFSWWLWRYCYRRATDRMSQEFRHNRKTSMKNIAQLWNLKYPDLLTTRTPYDSLVVVFANSFNMCDSPSVLIFRFSNISFKLLLSMNWNSFGLWYSFVHSWSFIQFLNKHINSIVTPIVFLFIHQVLGGRILLGFTQSFPPLSQDLM